MLPTVLSCARYWKAALHVVRQIASALGYMYSAGIVHRDIKPGNVMLTPSGDVKVMDFGIARAISDAQSTMTQTAAVVGTAQYLSPEQARGETVDSRSDVYSTGCLLYELLTGRTPFDSKELLSAGYDEIRRIIREDEPPKPLPSPAECSPSPTPIDDRRRAGRRSRMAAYLRGRVARPARSRVRPGQGRTVEST